jgi:hypothetical protein
LLNKYFVPSPNGCREASQSLLCCSVSQGVYCRIRGLVIRNASTPRFHPKPLSLSKTPLSSNFHFRCSRPHLNTFTQHNTTQYNTTQHKQLTGKLLSPTCHFQETGDSPRSSMRSPAAPVNTAS